MNVPRGFLFGGINCGIKSKKLDLGLIFCEQGAEVIGFFTKNANPSYSVLVSKKHIKNLIKAVIVNSGNANCFTRPQDLNKTMGVCRTLARILKIREENVLIASTGVIGKPLPFGKITKNLSQLCTQLTANPVNFAKSIVTTDRFIKISSSQVKLDSRDVRIMGIAKGAGMIAPELATMLVFILTDALISKSLLKRLSREAVEKSFNSISVDGCMSTNDSVYILSSKKGGKIESNKEVSKFKKALGEVCKELAQKIVRDGEGSSKFIEVKIKNAKTEEEAKRAFKAIANSLLFRTAIYGANPNWGRIVAALGGAGIELKEDGFKVKASSLKKKEVRITVDLSRGRKVWVGWCCDITPGYIKINMGYS